MDCWDQEDHGCDKWIWCWNRLFVGSHGRLFWDAIFNRGHGPAVWTGRQGRSSQRGHPFTTGEL